MKPTPSTITILLACMFVAFCVGYVTKARRWHVWHPLHANCPHKHWEIIGEGDGEVVMKQCNGCGGSMFHQTITFKF